MADLVIQGRQLGVLESASFNAGTENSGRLIDIAALRYSRDSGSRRVKVAWAAAASIMSISQRRVASSIKYSRHVLFFPVIVLSFMKSASLS